MRIAIAFASSSLLVACGSYEGHVLETVDAGTDSAALDAGLGGDGAVGRDGGDLDGGCAPGSCEVLTCGPPPAGYGGPLCGTSDDPCELRDDDLVDDPHFRNDAPALALGADGAVSIVYSIAEGGYAGWIAEGAGLSSTSLPFPLATAAAAYHGDTLTVLTDDGAFGLTLRARAGDGFTTLGTRSGTSGAASMTLDQGGCAHVAYGPRDDGIAYALWDGDGWTETPIVDGGASSPFTAVALASDGTPELAFRHADGTEGGVYWQRLGESAELVPGSESSGSISLAPLRMRVAGDAPHLLFRSDGSGDLVYAVRTAGAWSTTALASDSGDRCAAPTAADQTCDYSFTMVRPIDLVATSGGTVRVFYGEITETGHLTSTCTPMGPGPGMTCTWNGAPTYTGRVMMHVPGSGSAAVASVAAVSGTAQIDATGTMHLAVYTIEPSGGDVALRHLSLRGSAPSCRPERVTFPMGGTLTPGTLCDDVFVHVSDAASAARVMDASPSFVCETDAGGGYECMFREGGTGGGPSTLDDAEITEICTVTVLEPPPESIVCMVYL